MPKNAGSNFTELVRVDDLSEYLNTEQQTGFSQEDEAVTLIRNVDLLLNVFFYQENIKYLI